MTQADGGRSDAEWGCLQYCDCVLVDTDMTSEMDEETKGRLVKRIPMRRSATPDEMAGPALFLCGPMGSYVTGHMLVADGGERAR